MERDECVIGGITITKFSRGKQYDVGVFVLHGRQQSVASFVEKQLDVIEQIVTEKHCVLLIEVRNHGTRMVSDIQNHGKQKNPNHPMDMYSIQYGTALDISYLIDTIPLYFDIKRFAVMGFSLGGHATLLALSMDDRLECGVSVVGCGDYASLMKSRNIDLTSRLDSLVKKLDPVHHPNRFINKHTLVIYGGNDSLVPQSANVKFEQKVLECINESTTFEIFVDPDAKHEFSLPMKSKVTQFLHCHL
jgi:hypothetical protein